MNFERGVVLRFLGAALSLMALHGVTRAAPDPQQMLAASDAIRNPGKPFQVRVTLTEFRAGKQVDANSLATYSRTREHDSQFMSLVRFVSPARDAGKLMLKNGNDLWFYDPSTKASVRLSPQQRLLGQASNGDVVTVNLAKDYSAALLAEEEIVDGERKTHKSRKLGLTATAEDVTYPKIELWLDVDNSRPLKARFFADSGRLLKTAYYRRYQQEVGAERPTETVIIDGLDPQSVTIMRFSDYVVRAIPESWFNRDYLPRFEE